MVAAEAVVRLATVKAVANKDVRIMHPPYGFAVALEYGSRRAA
jgi:hypothetical protein